MLFMVYPNMIPTKLWRLGTIGSNNQGGPPGSESGQMVGTSSNNNAQAGSLDSALKASRYKPKICLSYFLPSAYLSLYKKFPLSEHRTHPSRISLSALHLL
jgi:hypothetical protein